MTAAHPQSADMAWAWRCLHCRGSLAADATGLHCGDCARNYPVLAGIPVLVGEPAAYIRRELASLNRTVSIDRQRREIIDRLGQDIGLPEASRIRHRDVLDAEIARTGTFLGLLEPFAAMADEAAAQVSGVRPTGWSPDALLPYLLRDWTGTAELAEVSARIRAVLRQLYPDPPGKPVVFAACGAGGLLAELAADSPRILGFDLTLPVIRAARHLLDGNSLDLALPRAINPAGRITRRMREPHAATSHISVAAMDAFDTAFADGSVECVVTSFLIDLLPEPRRLSAEIHRILGSDGIWINYGPSGPLNALWRFDQAECTGFLETAGFSVITSEAWRATYLDLSRDNPAWSFQNHVCYLTVVRKGGPADQPPDAVTPDRSELPAIVPQHFPGATLVFRRSLGAEQAPATLFRHQGGMGQAKSFDIAGAAVRMMELVDGSRTVGDIAVLLQQEQPADETLGAFARCFRHGMLTWRGR